MATFVLFAAAKIQQIGSRKVKVLPTYKKFLSFQFYSRQSYFFQKKSNFVAYK